MSQQFLIFENKILLIHRVQELAGRLTSQLVEKVKNKQPFDGNRGDDVPPIPNFLFH